MNCPVNPATLLGMESKKTSQTDTPLTARQRAEQYGIDVSLIDINLQKTPYERLQNHNQALKLALLLREAMEHPHD
ncbi:MAG: hypothetical protein HQ515_05885 [Phycisphaeraceae bacterium]|nr:hypothetical protein [Phycisphaeraceae bacterium]